jgi:hypothetical protein
MRQKPQQLLLPSPLMWAKDPNLLCSRLAPPLLFYALAKSFNKVLPSSILFLQSINLSKYHLGIEAANVNQNAFLALVT